MRKKPTTKPRRRAWTAADLASMVEDRQLSLLTYLDAFNASFKKQIRQWDPPTRELGDVSGNAHDAAATAVLKDGIPAWGTLRRLIYERDGGICWLCRDPVVWGSFDMGHLHDRVVGGSDHPTNLVVMCAVCNRLWKPLHYSRTEAEEWAREWRGSGGAVGRIGRLLPSEDADPRSDPH